MTQSGAKTAVRPLRNLLVALCIVPTLLFAVVALLSLEKHYEEASERLRRSVDILHEHAQKVFETNELVATHINEMLTGLDDDAVAAREPELNKRLLTIKASHDQIQDIWVLNHAGRPLVTAMVFPVPRDLNLADRDYYQVHRDGRVSGIYVSEVLEGRVNHDATFFQLSKPRTRADGSFAGVIAVSIYPGYFGDFYPRVDQTRDFTAGLIRIDGAVLAHHPSAPDDLRKLRPDSIRARAIAQNPNGGSFRGKSLTDGIDRIWYQRKLDPYPVYVSGGVSIDSIRRDWLQELGLYLAFGAPAALGLILLTLLSMRSTAQEAKAHADLRAEVKRREATEEQLRQASKMEAVGRLTGGIAHDFNNMLTAIGGNLDALLRHLPEDQKKLRLYAERAKLGMERAAKLTRHLLAFARQQPLRPRQIDLNRLIAGTSDLLRQTLGENIDVETVLDGDLWKVLVDGNQLEHVLLNLAVNARDAMPNGGRLRIETSNIRIDDAGLLRPGTPDDLTPGEYVLMTVSDTGVGMSEDVVAQAFEPFFTTKRQGAGTGLGLSQVYGFVKQSDGYVTIVSAEGHGAAVKIYLPRHMAETEAPDESPEPPVDENDLRSSGDETVLLVEDDAEVRRYTAEVLRDFNYRVIEADDGPSALAALKETPDLALLLTDVVLPGPMNGREIATEVQRQKPGIKVAFISGYARDVLAHDGRLDDDVRLLSKPFTYLELLRKVRRVLDREPAREALAEDQKAS